MPPATAERRKQTAHRVRTDPVWFVEHVLGWPPWSKQREILAAVRDEPRVAVRSGHGVGKTRIAAASLLWFLSAFPGSRVISTAPTFKPGVRDLLWREVRSQHRQARVLIGGRCMTTDLELADDWFAAGYSTDEPERFSGHHAEHLLLIVDEASGVAREIFEAAEGFMTGEHARVLLIGNPTRTTGQFYDAFHSERALWETIHVNVLESPNLTGEEVAEETARALTSKDWVEDKRRKWGEGSPLWQVRVEGEFNRSADTTVISLQTIEVAQQRETEPSPFDTHVIACDVARFGSDETVIAHRHGRKVRIVESYQGHDLMQTAGAIVKQWRIAKAKIPRGDHPPPLITVDDTGLGGGVTDRLREQGYTVNAFNGGEQAIRPEDYPNRRSEVWFAAAEELQDVDLDDDEQLAADLVAPMYKLDSRGRRVVEPKSETKKRLGRSPDRGDAVLLAFAPERNRTMEIW